MKKIHLPTSCANAWGPLRVILCKNHCIQFVVLLMLLSGINQGLSAQAIHDSQHNKAVWNKVNTAKSNGKSFKSIKVFNADTKSHAQEFSLAVQKGEVFDLSANEVQSLLKSKPQQITLEIPSSIKGKSLKLDLVNSNLFAEGFKLTTSTEPGVNQSIDLGLHYHGVIAGDPSSLAAISVYQDMVMGQIMTNEGNYTLGKLEGATSKHILYLDKDLKKPQNFECGMLDDGVGYEPMELSNNKSMQSCPIEIYVEVGYSIYSGLGFDLTATFNFAAGLHNQSFVLYANESITMQLSSILAWTAPDPYSGPDSFGYLAQFQAQTGAYNGDLGNLIVLDNVGGVAAAINGLCDPDTDQTLCINGLEGLFYENAPIYTFNLYVITHEMGHLMGSRHTHACVWNGNNTAIDGCSGFTEGGCVLPGSPPAGGTVMSYCHNDPVGINFNLGFGPQPGNVIRNVANNATCLNSCCVPPDVSAPTVTQPNCATPTGIIEINASSNGTLEYSVDDGGSWQTSNTFSGLIPGSYDIKVRLQNNPSCMTAYAQNPVVLNPGTSGGLTYVGNVSFTSQTQVDNWDPCYSIIQGNVIVSGYGIFDLGPLNSVESITGNLTIQYTSLFGMNGLNSLASVGGTVLIYNNPILSTLIGLEALNSVGASFYMYYNFMLTDCCAIRNLINGGVAGTTVIYFNKAGCNSVAQINSNCAPAPIVGSPNGNGMQVASNFVDERSLALFPNPAQDKVTVKVTGRFDSGSLKVVDFTGRTIHSQALMGNDSNPVIQLGNWNAGVYFVQVQVDGETFTQKLIVN